MTNVELQQKCNMEKWMASKLAEKDLSGQMDWCVGCTNNINNTSCKLNEDEETRTTGCYCAKNRRKINKKR